MNPYILVILHETGSDLGALGVEGNGDGSEGLAGGGLTSVVNDRLVVLVRTVGEVHTDCRVRMCAYDDATRDSPMLRPAS